MLDAIRQNPTTGVAAKDLYGMLEPLGYKKSAINAALFQLSKEGMIEQSGRRQPYKVVSGARAAAVVSAVGAASNTDEEPDAAP